MLPRRSRRCHPLIARCGRRLLADRLHGSSRDGIAAHFLFLNEIGKWQQFACFAAPMLEVS